MKRVEYGHAGIGSSVGDDVGDVVMEWPSIVPIPARTIHATPSSVKGKVMLHIKTVEAPLSFLSSPLSSFSF